MAINSRQTLSVYPLIKEIGYADPINSEALNEQLESLQESVLRSLIRTQEINTSLGTFEGAVAAQANAIASEYAQLQYTKENGKAFVTAFDTTVNIINNNITVDKLYGYITLSTTATYSKIPRLEGYDGKVSPAVKIFINSVEQLFDSDPYRAVDSSTKTIWFDQYPADSEASSLNIFQG